MNQSLLGGELRGSNWKFSVWLALILALLSGCISHTRQLPQGERLLKANSMSKPALLEKLTSRSVAIKTLIVSKSTLKASRMLSGEAIKDWIGLGGTIVVDRPSHIYLEIEKIGLTMADMVSDDKQFKVSVPHGFGAAKYGVGDVGAPPATVEFPYNLRPSHILDALFVDGEQYVGGAGITTILREDTFPQTDGIHSYYVIDFAKNEIPLEELWIDRTNNSMDVWRKVKYKEDGGIEADIRYSDYGSFDSKSFPKTIVINRPIENYSLEMQFGKLDLNKDVNPEAFILERPPGSDLIDLSTGKAIKNK